MESDTVHDSEWTTLSTAYVLGEAILDDEFKDDIMDALCSKIRSMAGSTIWRCYDQIVKLIYEGTTDASKARSFLVDLFTWHGAAVDLASICEVAPKEFFVDVAVALQKKRAENSVHSEPLKAFGRRLSQACQYHSHGEHEDCNAGNPGRSIPRTESKPSMKLMETLNRSGFFTSS